MVSQFKEFLVKHGVVALAIAVVMGAAVGKLVTAVVADLIMPIVGAVIPGGNWRAAVWQVGNIKFGVGDFLGAILDFLIVALVVFLMVKQINRLKAKPAPAAAPTTRECPRCLSAVPLRATRCAFCTSDLQPAAGR